MPVPHDVPCVTSVPVSVHTGPLEQVSFPTWHGLLGVHAAPCVHATHEPLAHTMLLPHEVPSVTCLAVSTQMDVPVEQLVVPWSQALPGVHERPSVHEAHEPSLQTMLVPHEVPLGT
jgi:hypothetical protein